MFGHNLDGEMRRAFQVLAVVGTLPRQYPTDVRLNSSIADAKAHLRE
jgi:hypothetical protein